MEWYSIKNSDEIDTPALVLYPERIKKNIGVAKQIARDPRRLRPHIKTCKCPQVISMMLQEGISKFKCATIAEAEMLAAQGAKDILLAHQPVGPRTTRLLQLQTAYPEVTFSCIVDNSDTLREMDLQAKRLGGKLRVNIDLNVGMNRTGIDPSRALGLADEARKMDSIILVGLHAYDGHLRDADLEARKAKCNESFRVVEALASKLKETLGERPVIVAGGSPTFPIHADRKDVELSPGTFVFWDKGYSEILKEQPFEFSALVLTRIISQPTPDTICIDLGHKAIASENPIDLRVHMLNASGLKPLGHSEEHMTFRVEKPSEFKVGDLLYGVPNHICPTVALYEEAVVVDNNVTIGSWPITARKRKITY